LETIHKPLSNLSEGIKVNILATIHQIAQVKNRVYVAFLAGRKKDFIEEFEMVV